MDIEFGTDGIRGEVNKDLCIDCIRKIGNYLGKGPKAKVLVAYDTRISCSLLFAELLIGILEVGGDLFSLGVAPTPSVSYLVDKYHFDYGVMITASHNPYYDNGMKVFNKSGEKIDENEKKKIISFYENKSVKKVLRDRIGHLHEADYLLMDYLDFLNKIEAPCPSKNIIDGGNGATSNLLKRLFDCGIINAEPNGININEKCGALYIQKLTKNVEKEHFGFSIDGDGDRLQVTTSDEVINGHKLIFLFAKYLKDKHLLNENKIVLTEITNIGLITSLKNIGIESILVPVGDQNVYESMKKYNISFGGEASGHFIFGGQKCSDSLFNMKYFLKIVSEINLDDYTKDLILYPEEKMNIQVEDKQKIMNDRKLLDLVKYYQNVISSQGKIIMRPSGTEKMIRLNVMGPNKNQNKIVIAAIKKHIQSIR